MGAEETGNLFRCPLGVESDWYRSAHAILWTKVVLENTVKL